MQFMDRFEGISRQLDQKSVHAFVQVVENLSNYKYLFTYIIL